VISDDLSGRGNIDHFSKYNSDFGHPGVDALLRALGKLLHENFCRREGDIACRWAGDEFALVLPEAPLDVTRTRAEDLREKVKRLNVRYEDKSLGELTISLGVAVFPEHGSSAEALIKGVDAALYRAKNGGRDRVEIAQVMDHE
jgi:diguanylate cyclase (GGDEF)-like protein